MRQIVQAAQIRGNRSVQLVSTQRQDCQVGQIGQLRWYLPVQPVVVQEKLIDDN